jgi:hypothetical protein
VNTRQAKQIIRDAMENYGLVGFKLTARTIDFTDLARASCIFVQIHAPSYEPFPHYQELRELAVSNNFRIEVRQ